MRSAGCIVNDILDKEFDAKVFRTKDRPIASGKISIETCNILFKYIVLFSFASFVKFQFIYNHLGFRFNATSFYLSTNEKVYLLATVISRYYI